MEGGELTWKREDSIHPRYQGGRLEPSPRGETEAAVESRPPEDGACFRQLPTLTG